MTDAPRLVVAVYTEEDVTGELVPLLRKRGFEAQSALEAELTRPRTVGSWRLPQLAAWQF